MSQSQQLLEGLTDRDALRLARRLVDDAGLLKIDPDDTEAAIAMLAPLAAQAWAFGVEAMHNARSGRHVCRICGCWELRACEGGCHWVEADLCSTCDPTSPNPGAGSSAPAPAEVH